MPSILNDTDKETVKRTVPKASNVIQAVAVAKLYVAYPNRNRWTYTGLQGAAVLSNDTVGNTFWIKLVDISPANRGVIWDQEIYDTFQYNQDRTFFHSFELEQCMAGLSFVDEKEARKFKKKMDEREGNATKATKAQAFGSNSQGGQVAMNMGHQSGSRLGRLFGRHRNNSNPAQPAQSILPARDSGYSTASPTSSRPTSGGDLDLADPSWRPILDELLQMGFSEEQLLQNADFIKEYVEKKQAENKTDEVSPSVSRVSRAAPPPPPPSGLGDSGGSGVNSGRRGPPPAPPPARRPVGGRAASPPRTSSPERTPSPPATPQTRFRAPPPLADAGKFAVKEGPASHPSGRERSSSGAQPPNPGPPPPPRPAKVLAEEDTIQGQKFGVPPPFSGDRKPVPPPPPSRGPVPPPPPSRGAGQPPSLPPKFGEGTLPPLPPARNSAPPLPPASARPIPPPPASSGPPAPPPLPPSASSVPPPPAPPPPPASAGGPPPPPPPPPGAGGSAPALPKATGGRNDLMAAIRGSGGKGGGGLRKVAESDKKDRSAAAVPGAESKDSGGAATGAVGGAGADAQGGLAGALAAALSQRKKKVSGSDDEDDGDDW